jgi:hypothetical protein
MLINMKGQETPKLSAKIEKAAEKQRRQEANNYRKADPLTPNEQKFMQDALARNQARIQKEFAAGTAAASEPRGYLGRLAKKLGLS